jgi:hypothetical protein
VYVVAESSYVYVTVAPVSASKYTVQSKSVQQPILPVDSSCTQMKGSGQYPPSRQHSAPVEGKQPMSSQQSSPMSQ